MLDDLLTTLTKKLQEMRSTMANPEMFRDEALRKKLHENAIWLVEYLNETSDSQRNAACAEVCNYSVNLLGSVLAYNDPIGDKVFTTHTVKSVQEVADEIRKKYLIREPIKKKDNH